MPEHMLWNQSRPDGATIVREHTTECCLLPFAEGCCDWLDKHNEDMPKSSVATPLVDARLGKEAVGTLTFLLLFQCMASACTFEFDHNRGNTSKSFP